MTLLTAAQKGISPLVATVLLIAFVVAVAGVIAAWSTTFAKEQTSLVGEQASLAVNCQYGKVNMKSLKFASASSTLGGIIENNGQISLGSMSLSVVYQNSTSEAIKLCNSSGRAVSCSAANLSLSASDLMVFNVSVGSNYDSIKLSTNCTSASDSAERGDVS